MRSLRSAVFILAGRSNIHPIALLARADPHFFVVTNFDTVFSKARFWNFRGGVDSKNTDAISQVCICTCKQCKASSFIIITQKIERGSHSIPSWDSSTESLEQLVKMEYNVYNDPN